LFLDFLFFFVLPCSGEPSAVAVTCLLLSMQSLKVRLVRDLFLLDFPFSLVAVMEKVEKRDNGTRRSRYRGDNRHPPPLDIGESS
jgi:hypothetical protein